jgi:putative transposase
VNRGSYYRWQRQRQGRTAPPAAPAGARQRGDPPGLRERVEALCTRHAGYGYRRVTVQLQREGYPVNHKRILRRLRSWGLLCRVRRRWLGRCASEPAGSQHPNRLAEQGWQRLTGRDQAWVADLTYVRVGATFAYLAVVLDAYSRRVVGWALGRRADQRLVLAALERALSTRQPAAGWIHHSDRGGQYTSQAYQARLEAAGAQISLSGKGRPLENALVESFLGTLKAEEVERQGYEGYGEAVASLEHYLEALYNRERLHSALGYRFPQEFEALQQPAKVC